MRKIEGFGNKWDEVAKHGSYKHLFLFRYLQISPSYRLAHKVIALKEKIPKKDLPKDFDQVIKTYKKFGDVYRIHFVDWWTNVGRRINDSSTTNKRLLLSIELSESDEILLSKFKTILKLMRKKALTSEHYLATFDVNKIRRSSLATRLDIVLDIAKSTYKSLLPNIDKQTSAGKISYSKKIYFKPSNTNDYSDWKKDEHWKLAKISSLKSSYLNQIKINSKKKLSNVKTRNYLSMLVSKNIKSAYFLAENAARGKFPSLDPIDSGIQFNYVDLSFALRDYRELTYKKINVENQKTFERLIQASDIRKKLPKRHSTHNLPDDYYEITK